MNPLLIAQILGSLISGAAGSGQPAQSGLNLPAAPASAGADPNMIAALAAALAGRPQQQAPASPAPAHIPFALNVLGSVLPVMTFIYGIGLIIALWAGASIGQTQIGLVVALALILGVLLALTCAVVFWFVGSSLGSWTKNFPAQQAAMGLCRCRYRCRRARRFRRRRRRRLALLTKGRQRITFRSSSR